MLQHPPQTVATVGEKGEERGHRQWREDAGLVLGMHPVKQHDVQHCYLNHKSLLQCKVVQLPFGQV